MEISEKLKELAKTYLAMVDEPDEHMGTPERDAERTAAHEALLDTMEAENVPFNSRFEARWMARWLLSGNEFDRFSFQPDVYWIDPTSAVKTLRHSPPDDNREGWIPVIAFVLPIENQKATYFRNV